MNQIDKVEAKIKNECFKYNLRMMDYMKSSDKLRKGYIGIEIFKKKWSNLKEKFNESELNCLVNYYILDNIFIDYVKFSKNIDEHIFNNEVKNSLRQKENLNSSTFKENELKLLNDIIEYLKYEVYSKRMFLKPSFQDFDKVKNKFVTNNQFLRVLMKYGLNLPDEYLKILCKKYVNKLNSKEINYVDFLNDIETKNDTCKIQNNTKIYDKKSSNIINDMKEKINLSAIIDRIRNLVYKKSIRIEQFFLETDYLRKKVVTTSQFRRILQQSNIILTDEELNLIHSNLKFDNNNIYYEKFCNQVNLIFGNKMLETNPLKEICSVKLNNFKTQINFSNDEIDLLSQLIFEIKQEIQNKRILLKPNFKDFDLTNNGFISKSQFIRVINNFNLCPLKYIELLCNKYLIENNQINYLSFINDTEEKDEYINEINQTHLNKFKNTNFNNEKSSNKNIKQYDINDILKSISIKTKKERIRISEFLIDFDKLRTNLVTFNQFKIGLNMAKINLNENEYECIFKNFKQEVSNSYFINWKKFIKSIEEIECNINQETLNFNNNEQTELFKNIFNKFKNYLKSTRIDIKQFFKDWDKLNRGKCSRKQFIQILTNLKFNFQPLELDEICKYYKYNDFIYYSYFLNDLKDITIITNKSKNENILKRKSDNITINNRNLDLNMILEKIKNYININRIRLREYFLDFDKMRKGYISKNQFTGILDKLKIRFDLDELSLLLDNFENKELKNMINYKDFNDIIDNSQEIYKSIINPEVINNINCTQNNEKINSIFNNLDENLIKLLKDIKREQEIKGLLLKPIFMDFDVSKSGKISFTRLRSILDSLGIRLTNISFDSLCNRFNFEEKEFNYILFNEAVKLI